MAFERLDIIVERLVGRIVDTGELGVDAPAQPPKGTRAEARAKFFRETPPVKEVHTDRCMTTATTRARPRSAVVIHLSVYREQRRHHATPF